MDEVDEGRGGERREPDAERQLRPETRFGALVVVADRRQQPLARPRGGAGATRAREQRSEREGADDLHADEQERVVARGRVGERLNVQPGVDACGETATGDFRHHDEKRECRKPPPSELPRDHCSHDHTPRRVAREAA